MTDLTGSASATPVAAPPPAPVSTPVSSWGDPFPLGLASFGLSGLFLAGVMSGVIDVAATPAVLAMAVALGFGTELVAGIIHFARGETFPGMVFVSYAGFWLSYALFVQFYAPQVTADAAAITGTYLLGWAIFTTYMLLAALKTNLTTIVVFALLATIFYLNAFAAFLALPGLGVLGGYLLFVDAGLALYASAAIIVNTTWERSVLPVP